MSKEHAKDARDTHGDSNSRGVATLIYDKDIHVIDVKPDPEGRYLLVKLKKNGEKYNILNPLVVDLRAPRRSPSVAGYSPTRAAYISD